MADRFRGILSPSGMGQVRQRKARTNNMILERRARVSDAMARGDTVVRIAQREKIGVSTALADMEAIRQTWLDRATINRELLIAAELNKLDVIEKEAWWAWERSKGRREETQTERVDGRSSRAKVSVKTHDRDGDPRFLEVIRACIEDRRKLLGLDEPTKIDIEMDIRAWARSEGLDEELAVAEAQRQLKILPPPESR